MGDLMKAAYPLNWRNSLFAAVELWEFEHDGR
jgi:hypothetical protein